MRQECADLGSPHFAGVPLIVEKNEPFHPGDVGLLGSVGEMFDAAGIGDLVEEPWFSSFSRGWWRGCRAGLRRLRSSTTLIAV